MADETADETAPAVAVVGAGAMGGMYAAHFAAAGLATTLVARGDRAARLRREGLVVNGTRVDTAVFDADRDAPPPVGLALLAVKHPQLADALEDLAPLVGPDTTLLSVLNGLDGESVIAERFTPGQVLLCIALGMDAGRDARGIRFTQAGRLDFGEADNTTPSARVRRVQDVLDRAGLAWTTPVDMRHALWWKFMVNVGINQASAALRLPYGAFQHDGDPRALMWALIEEVVTVAAAEGVHLSGQDLARWDAVLAAQPPDGRTSMHQDIEAGRPTEVAIFAGRVVALGDHHHLPTPWNQTMLRMLRRR